VVATLIASHGLEKVHLMVEINTNLAAVEDFLTFIDACATYV
jgi:hypothetical protein